MGCWEPTPLGARLQQSGHECHVASPQSRAPQKTISSGTGLLFSKNRMNYGCQGKQDSNGTRRIILLLLEPRTSSAIARSWIYELASRSKIRIASPSKNFSFCCGMQPNEASTPRMHKGASTPALSDVNGSSWSHLEYPASIWCYSRGQEIGRRDPATPPRAEQL